MRNEIKLYGIIGEDVTAVDVKRQLDAFDQSQELVVRIHSEGGSVPDGIAIYDAVKTYPGPKRAVIESAAFSIASYIAMAFDDVEITENGYLMIHNPYMETVGDDVAHAQSAECLAKFKESLVAAYSSRTGKSRDEVLSLMANETWINAREALANGYVSRIAPPQMRAVAKLKNMPQGVFKSLSGGCSDAGENRVSERVTVSESTKPVAASLAEIRAAFPKAKAEFVLNCIERNLPMASVMTEALAAMEEELTQARAKLAEYEQKEMAAKAEMEVSVEQEPEEEEEPMPMPVQKAKAKLGVRPVAKSTATKPSAKAQWETLVAAKVSAGLPRSKAVLAVHKDNPGLREQMVEEINLARKGAE